MAIQRIRSKLAKTGVLLQNASLRAHIPATAKMTPAALSVMLARHGMVYVKPDGGTFGNGVIRVERAGGGYRFQHGTRVRSFASLDALYAGLLRDKKPGVYVVQRGIHLLKHQNRRFDLRVMVQRNAAGRWEATGIIGRLAHPKKIVTNYHNGGTPMPFSRLMGAHLPADRHGAYIRRLHSLGVTVGRQLEKRYPRLQELGLDIALDDKLHPWILEVNTCPDPFIFRKLPDRSVFHRIYRYAVRYGRFKARRA